MDNIQVSIIIPMWNVEGYIAQSLDCVQNQDFNLGLECIIIDDCGQDNSYVVAQRKIEDYYGPYVFKLIRHPFNKGVSAARNTGIKHARGKYVFFFDADDKITPHCISAMYDTAKKYDYPDMVIGNYSLGSDKTGLFFQFKDIPDYINDKVWISNAFLKPHFINNEVWNKLIKRDLYNEYPKLFFNEKLKFAEDIHIKFFFSKYINSIGISREITYDYNIPNIFNRHSIMETISSLGNSKKNEIYKKTFRIIIDDWIESASKPNIGNQIQKIKSTYDVWTFWSGERDKVLEKKIRELGGYFTTKELFRYTRLGVFLRRIRTINE